jgi:beta-lactamase superfamily II metal-dependent hydrolase
MTRPIRDDDLVVHVLNIGFGDSIVVEFPADAEGLRRHALVDCRRPDKVRGYLRDLAAERPARAGLAFLCATHPHGDHISGIPSVLADPGLRPDEFWDSGFRHNSNTYRGILLKLHEIGVPLVRASSGMEWHFGRVRVTCLAPSIALRNRYATYGVDMNNASIVLRLEHHDTDVLLAESKRYEGALDPEMERSAGTSVVILAGDAEFDSWAKVTEEFPRLETTDEHEPLVKKMVNPLACSVIKVSHHGSMHSAPLDVYEKMCPELAVVSSEQQVSTKTAGGRRMTRGLFPHQTAALALAEVGARVVTTDGSYESEEADGGGPRDPDLAHEGSVVVVVPPGGRPVWRKLDDPAGRNAPVVADV